MKKSPLFLPKKLISNLIIASLYCTIGVLCFIASISIGNATPIWPPSGIALGSLLRWGYHLAPGIWFGAFLSNIVNIIRLTGNVPLGFWGVALGIGSGAILQALLGAFLIRHFIKSPKIFNQASNIFKFLAIELVSCTVSPTFGMNSLCLGNIVPWSDFQYSWFTWWLGDLAGVLIMTPIILVWHFKDTKLSFKMQLKSQKLIEITLWLSLLLVIVKIAFSYRYPVEYLMIHLLVWSAFRFGQRWTTLTVFVVDVIAIVGSSQGVSSFIRQSLNDTLLLLQAFVGSVTITTLVLSAVIKQQKLAEINLEKANSELELRVEERTGELKVANQEIQALNERLKADNLRMSAELDVTRQLQQMILPKEAELNQIQELDIAGFMEPAEEVGGDYYDVILDHEQNNYIKIGIGDVTGHGLESGVLMIMIQTAVRTLIANNETNINKFLNTLNRVIYENIERIRSDKFITFSFLNYTQGNLMITGQHEEVIIVRKGGIIERIDTLDLGFPLGLEADISSFINSVNLTLNVEDGIVLYTDGITEAENVNQELYGLERLCETLHKNWHRSAAEIREKVIQDVRYYIGGNKVYDDITLVILKRK